MQKDFYICLHAWEAGFWPNAAQLTYQSAESAIPEAIQLQIFQSSAAGGRAACEHLEYSNQPKNNGSMSGYWLFKRQMINHHCRHFANSLLRNGEIGLRCEEDGFRF